MPFSVQEGLGLVYTGILSLLWVDLRNVRKSYKENKEGYLTEEKHKLICENSMLRVEKKIDTVKMDIIKEIKNGHG